MFHSVGNTFTGRVQRSPIVTVAVGNLPFAVSGVPRTTVGVRGAQGSPSHCRAAEYRCPRRRGGAGSCGPRRRNRDWVGRGFQVLAADEIDRSRCFDKQRTRVDHDFPFDHHDDDFRTRCAVLRTCSDTDRTAGDAHDRVRDTNRDGYRHHMERMGSRDGRPGYRNPQRRIRDDSGGRGRLPCRKRHLSGHLGHAHEGRFVDAAHHF